MTLLNVEIVCSDPKHPVMPWLRQWRESLADRAKIDIYADVSEVGSGDFLFLIACQQIVGQDVRSRFRFTLVIHESDLPQGRGWSPLVWQILDGQDEIPVTMLNAVDRVDAGDIWAQLHVRFSGTELATEINDRISQAKIELMTWALDHCDTAAPRQQTGEPSFYPKRRPADSEIDPNSTFAEAFDLLRIADEERYPAFLQMRGQRYRVRLDPMPGIQQEVSSA